MNETGPMIPRTIVVGAPRLADGRRYVLTYHYHSDVYIDQLGDYWGVPDALHSPGLDTYIGFVERVCGG